MIVPTPTRIVVGLAAIGLTGAALTLVHPSPSQSSNVTSSIQDTGLSAQSLAQPNAQDVVENPSVSVSVDGQSVPVTSGTTHLKTKNGNATVSASGGSVSVNRVETTTPNSSARLDVNVRSNASTGSSVSTFNHSHTSTSSSGFSQTTVNGMGSGSVQVHTSTQP